MKGRERKYGSTGRTDGRGENKGGGEVEGVGGKVEVGEREVEGAFD